MALFFAFDDAHPRVPTGPENAIEIGGSGRCVLCGEIIAFAETAYECGGVCCGCADNIANHYNWAHSGAWLTWPNPEFDRGKQKIPIPEALRWRVFERDGFACKKCGARSMLRADHIFPESKGGLATLENLQTLCCSCNSKKGQR